MSYIFLIISICIFVGGCALLPKNLREVSFNKEITLSKVLASPQKYKNQNVLWGGKIVNCLNEENSTILEIVEFPLNIEGRPLTNKKSQGRFIVETSKFLDCAIYSPQKFITVVGTFITLKDGKIGKKSYKFPLLKSERFHLWEEEIKIEMETPCFYNCWIYYPCYPCCPWYCPCFNCFCW